MLLMCLYNTPIPLSPFSSCMEWKPDVCAGFMRLTWECMLHCPFVKTSLPWFCSWACFFKLPITGGVMGGRLCTESKHGDDFGAFICLVVILSWVAFTHHLSMVDHSATTLLSAYCVMSQAGSGRQHYHEYMLMLSLMSRCCDGLIHHPTLSRCLVHKQLSHSLSFIVIVMSQCGSSCWEVPMGPDSSRLGESPRLQRLMMTTYELHTSINQSTLV